MWPTWRASSRRGAICPWWWSRRTTSRDEQRMRALFHRAGARWSTLLEDYRRGVARPPAPAPRRRRPARARGGHPGGPSGLQLPRPAQRGRGQPRPARGRHLPAGEAHAGGRFRPGARARAAGSVSQLHGAARGAQPGGGHLPPHAGGRGRLRAGAVGARPLLLAAGRAHRHLPGRPGDHGGALPGRLRGGLVRHTDRRR